ncbi:hypothetical protein Sjap_009169 [Stephania japonica]|uniref:Bifunctional inhibitor/plant lipid transfer protein/seed storage helical domain-containing protein n=1 Tax=Stephania japonica TaxID=461633 RepID=A0AAP0JRT8_9MAGN
MDMRKVGQVLVVTLVVFAIVDGMAAFSLCNMSGDDLELCKPAVTKDNTKPPTKACCDVLSKADLDCFCQYKDSFLMSSFGVDPDLAVALPPKCNLTTPASCS